MLERAPNEPDLGPRHLQLRATLFRRWKMAGLKVGDMIESQNQIVRLCDFSLITIIKTLKDLEAEGVIRRQVGKGSFLLKTPWSEAHYRIGYFYSRDLVGGGIFNNDTYTKVVAAFEKKVVSDGHEFILGSFTRKSMPVHLWDALDIVVLTGITKENDLTRLSETSSQVAVLDLTLKGLPYNAYRVDFEPAFKQMFQRYGKKQNKYLYLDSAIKSDEQSARLRAFRRACAESEAPQELEVIAVNKEHRVDDTGSLVAALRKFKPDFVCGHIHRSWLPLIAEASPRGTKIFPYAFVLASDTERPGFVVKAEDWMEQVLGDIYANLENRRPDHRVLTFDAALSV